MNFPLHEHFLLHNRTARALFEEVAEGCPVIDFHTHLDSERYYRNEPFSEISDLWIRADPYKWRAMRMNGIPERVITGDASPEERFMAWAATIPALAGNPLFHWSRLELKRFFGIDILLTSDTAEKVRAECNEQLGEPHLRPRALLKKCGVEVFMTSDPWCGEGDLDVHQRALKEQMTPTMVPSLRADDVLDIGSNRFAGWIEGLESATEFSIHSLDDLQQALRLRLDVFSRCGCTLADLGLDRVPVADCSEDEAGTLFTKWREGRIESLDTGKWTSYWVHWIAAQCSERNWLLQLHLGARRQTSDRLAGLSTGGGGYACIGNSLDIAALTRLLNSLENAGGVPRMLLYPLNPNDMEPLASLCGAFVEDGVPGKLQVGAAWWYNDHRDGIEKHLRALANHALLGRFPGMITDSRSYLSGVRHEFFRRVLCNLLGQWVEAGELPTDDDFLHPLVRGLCYGNARQTFFRPPRRNG
ncbi:MAG: glucuronate isomerase [Kiritimatiellae bacterium]|nr:glucuronate isomerase [Kiritimatiellia bacterium]